MTANNNNRGRTSLLTDYSRFKADVRPTSQEKKIPCLPPSSHRSGCSSRSRSGSRRSRCASLVSSQNNGDYIKDAEEQQEEEFASVSTRNKFKLESEELLRGQEGDETRKKHFEIDVSEMDHLQEEVKPMQGAINFTRMDSGLIAVPPALSTDISLKDPFDLDDDTDSTFEDDLMLGGGGGGGGSGDPRMIQSEVIISCRRAGVGGGASTSSPFHGSDTSLSLGMLNMEDTDAEEEDEEEEEETEVDMSDEEDHNNIDDSAIMGDASLLCASEPGFIRVRRSNGSNQNSMTMLGLDSSSPEQGGESRDRRCRSNSRSGRSSSKPSNKYSGNGSASSLTNYLEVYEAGRTKSNLQSTGATTEDLRMEMNRLLMDTRLNRRRSSSSCSAATAARRQRRNTMNNCGSTNHEDDGTTTTTSRRKTPGRSKTLPEDLLGNTMKKGTTNGLSSSGSTSASTYLPASMLGARRRPSAPARSKSMGSAESAVAAAAAAAASSNTTASSMPRMKSTRSSENIRSMLSSSQPQPQQAQQHHPALRRFRRQQQRNSCHSASAGDHSAAIANLHNSTGRIDFSGVLNAQPSAADQEQQVSGTRKAPRRSKSMASSLPSKSSRRGSLPERSKTITYTTTRGKNKVNGGGGELGTSNHGFLTGSRIKRIIPNNMN